MVWVRSKLRGISENYKISPYPSETKLTRENSLLYLFSEYALAKNKIVCSPSEISDCAEWLQSGCKSRSSTELRKMVKKELKIILKLLLNAKNDVNYSKHRKKSILHVFLERYARTSEFPNNDCNLVRTLVWKGASVEAIDEVGNTPLHLSIIINRIDLLQVMLPYSNDLNIRNKVGYTLLHFAVCNCEANPELYLKLIQTLIVRGADPRCADNGSLAPIDLALRYGLTEVLYVIEECGFNIHEYLGGDSQVLMNLCKNVKHWSRSMGEVQLIDLLVNLEKDVHARSKTFEMTPLHFVVQADQLDVIEILLKAGADINALSKDGVIPLHLAMLRNSLPIVEYLIEHGANVALNDATLGFGLMHLAVLSADLDKVKMVIKKGFNVNEKSKHGLRPLHLAVLMYDTVMLKCVLQHCIHYGDCIEKLALLNQYIPDVKVHQCVDENMLVGTDEYTSNMSVIYQCVEFIRVKTSFVNCLIDLLLEAGANINARDSCSKSPLHYAALHKGKVSQLLRHGAYVDVHDVNKTLPLAVALNSGNLEGAKDLIKYGADLNDIDFNFSEWDESIRKWLTVYLGKLRVLDFPVPGGYKLELAYINSYDKTNYEREFLRMYDYLLIDDTTGTNSYLYEIIHMDLRQRLRYAQYLLDWNSTEIFPIFNEIIEARYRSALNRNRLMTDAALTLRRVTNIDITEDCTNKLFKLFHNTDLVAIIATCDGQL